MTNNYAIIYKKEKEELKKYPEYSGSHLIYDSNLKN